MCGSRDPRTPALSRREANDVFPTLTDLEAGLPLVRQSPRDAGHVALIVRRPRTDMREILAEAALSSAEGLAGDAWAARPGSRSAERSPNPDTQLTLMNSRVISLLAGTTEQMGPGRGSALRGS